MIKISNDTNNSAHKGLFLCFEGIGSTIFDSQIALHAKEMRDENIDLEIWAFETWPGCYKKSKERLASATQLSKCKIRLFRGFFVYLPLSDILNALLLWFHLVRLRPNIQFVHARSDYSTAVCSYISFIIRIPIIWDCRGDSEAEFDFSYNAKNAFQKIAKYFYLHIIRFREYFAAKTCTKAIFVSQALFNRKRRYLKTHTMHEIIPCAASSDIFFFSEKFRYETRLELGFSNSDIVLIYSGGMVKWEAFPDYVSMFRQLNNQDKKYKFLIVTTDIERAELALTKLDHESYKLMSAPFSEMNALYNASDFGCLIRHQNILNHVASPVKFAEFCLAGLPIIMNNSVEQAYDFAQELGNLILYKPELSSIALLIMSDAERRELAKRANSILSRSSLVHLYFQVYSFSR